MCCKDAKIKGKQHPTLLDGYKKYNQNCEINIKHPTQIDVLQRNCREIIKLSLIKNGINIRMEFDVVNIKRNRCYKILLKKTAIIS